MQGYILLCIFQLFKSFDDLLHLQLDIGTFCKVGHNSYINLVKKNLNKTLSIFNCLDDQEHPRNQELGPNMVKQRERDLMMKYFLW